MERNLRQIEHETEFRVRRRYQGDYGMSPMRRRDNSSLSQLSQTARDVDFIPKASREAWKTPERRNHTKNSEETIKERTDELIRRKLGEKEPINPRENSQGRLGDSKSRKTENHENFLDTWVKKTRLNGQCPLDETPSRTQTSLNVTGLSTNQSKRRYSPVVAIFSFHFFILKMVVSMFVFHSKSC